MKKKIVAILATIAAVFGFGFAANTAMAVDYGPTGAGKVSGNTAVFTFKNLDNSKTYIVSSDDQNAISPALSWPRSFTPTLHSPTKRCSDRYLHLQGRFCGHHQFRHLRG